VFGVFSLNTDWIGRELGSLAGLAGTKAVFTQARHSEIPKIFPKTFWNPQSPGKGPRPLPSPSPLQKGGCQDVVLLQLKRGGVSKAKGEGEKEKECTTECKSRRRRGEKAPWALNYESGEGGG
jgi:hypothetical protein